MDPEAVNRLQVLVALSGFIPGLITIYAPTWFFLRQFNALPRSTFLKDHPEKHIPIVLYEVLFFACILTSPVISLLLVTRVTDWMAPFMLFCTAGNIIGILNGMFEIITSISPVHGISFRAYHKETYLLHPTVRKIGLVRIIVGMVFILLFLFLFHSPSGV